MSTMTIVNNSERLLDVYLHNGLPYGKETLIGSKQIANAHKVEFKDLAVGQYYVWFQQSNVGPLPAGSVVACCGGVTEKGTVTLTVGDRIEVS